MSIEHKERPRRSAATLTTQFFALADCYGASDQLCALRTSVAALALHENEAPAEAPWLSAASPLPSHARMAARRGAGALYAALRGLRCARLSWALRQWAVTTARFSTFLVLPPSHDSSRLSVENLTLAHELAESEAKHARQSAVMRVELDRAKEEAGQEFDRRLSELMPGLVVCDVVGDDAAEEARLERLCELEDAAFYPLGNRNTPSQHSPRSSPRQCSPSRHSPLPFGFAAAITPNTSARG